MEILIMQRLLLLIVIVTNLVVFERSALAAMGSANYQIWADAITVGGNRSTSAGFIVDDTIGEGATGEDAASTSFLLDAGLPAIFAEPILRMTVSAGAITLAPDPITSTEVSTGSYTITVSTNAPLGYTLSVTEDGNFRAGTEQLVDVSDGTVTAGVSEYGLSVTGTDAAFGDHRAVSGAPMTVATRTTFVNNSVNTITHNAARSPANAAGAYAHTVTYSLFGNF